MRVATWNMQGASHKTEAKWNHCVAALVTHHAEVLCLQECGAVPASAQFQGTLPNNVQVFRWGGTHSRPGFWIGFYPWDTSGNRCNLAVVTRGQPATYMVVWPAGPSIHRPALGALMPNGGQYYSLHAISPGGADGPGLLTAIAAAAAGAPWCAAGDFNREPGTVQPGPGNAVCAPRAYTYKATSPAPTKTIDFAVRSGPCSALPETMFLQFSDHFPVVLHQI